MNGHVKHGYLGDLIEHWLWEGSEWGEQMRALHEAYHMGEDYAGFSCEQLDQILAILLNRLKALFESTHFVDYGDDHDDEMIKNARAEYPSTRDYWKDRSISFHAEESFEATDALIPSWMKP